MIFPSTGAMTTNDTLNGVPATTANTDVTPVTNGPLSIDTDGVTVAQTRHRAHYTIVRNLRAGAIQ
jgi:hypothetical protein